LDYKDDLSTILDNKSYLDFNNFADTPPVDSDKKEAAVILVPK